MIRITFTTAVIFATLVLAGCSALGAPENSSGTVVGPVWILTELFEKEPVPGTTVYLEFSEDGSVNGSDGCNNIGRQYTTDGDSISFSPAGPTTLMACPQPIMNQASAFHLALDEAASYSIEGDTLTLFDPSDNALASFQAQDQSLEGSSWTVLSYNNGKGGFTSVILETEITAEFSDDGIVSGSDGCNGYSRPYETEGSSITFGELGPSTMMACPEEIMEQGTAYLQALTNSTSYEIIGDSMTLYDAEGTRMVLFTQ